MIKKNGVNFMIFMSEKQKKINDLYTQLRDLKEGKKVLENAMHNNYYNKDVYSGLYEKLKKLMMKINYVKAEIELERKNGKE